MTIVKAFAETSTGKVRKENQDCYRINHQTTLYILADGMGGHKAGKFAAQKACDTFNNLFNPHDNDKETHLTRVFVSTNNSLFQMAQQKAEYDGMGATFIACHIQHGFAHFCHAGDTRAYFFRNNELSQITEDHSTVALLLKNGLINIHDAKQHPLRNRINRAIGTQANTMPDYNKIPVVPNDIILLCSDGLWSAIDDNEIEIILKKQISSNEKLKLLHEQANQSGGNDNITAILIKIVNKKPIVT